MTKKKIIYWDRLLSLITCVLIIGTIALQKNGRIMGQTAEEIAQSNDEGQNEVTTDTIQWLQDGTMIVHTRPLAQNVIGFGGPTPLNIYINNGIIERIEPEPNSETPELFDNAKSVILPHYEQKSIEAALSQEIDAVSGATYSSNALMENIKRGLSYAQVHIGEAPKTEKPTDSMPIKNLWQIIIGCAVVLMGAIIPLITKNKIYRLLQLSINVIVLGVWCGTFISYSLLVNFMSNGINLAASLIAVLMLVVVALFPIFGQSRHYCLWICPLGSAQELIWRFSPLKKRTSKAMQMTLSLTRWTIWTVLMILMTAGIWMEWMDYEIFSIFVFQQASWVVIVLAVTFAILSLFTQRPYCHFLCPTGCLLQAAENKKMSAQM